MIEYFHIASKTDGVAYATRAWEAEHIGSEICRKCHSHRSGIGRLDVHLEDLPDRSPLTIVMGIGTGLIRQEFIDELGRIDVENHLNLGRVFDEKGKLVPELATFTGKAQDEFRGDKRSTFRICNECRRILYYARGLRYLVDGDFSGAPISESPLHQLIISKEIFDRIDKKRWKKMGVEKLPLVLEPKDGRPIRLADCESAPSP